MPTVSTNERDENVFPGVISGLTRSKVEELQLCQQTSHGLFQKASSASDKFRMKQELVSSILQVKKRIEVLRRIRHDQIEELTKLKMEGRKAESTVEQLKRRSQRVKTKKTKITEYMSTKTNIVKKSAADLASDSEELETIRKQQVSDLITHIFPIVGVSQHRTHIGDQDSSQEGDDDHDPQSEINLLEEELAEARRLSFVHGRWIYDQGEGPDIVRISIASNKACAPADGDYSACQIWLKAISSTNKSIASSDISDSASSAIEYTEMHRSPGASIFAALYLSTQLLHTIRKLLCIHMPYKHHYRQFSDANMTDQDFLWNVRRLNGNVLALCLHYGVEPHLIHPLHTLPNIQNAIQMFLHNPESTTSSILTPELVTSMEEALNDSSDPLCDDDEDRMDELLTEWENSLADEDWDSFIPKHSQDSPHHQYVSAAPYQSQQEDMGQSQGLVSSAVAWAKGWWIR